MNVLKIIEWNMQSIASYNENNQDRIKKIIDEIIEQEADVVVLTEITSAQRLILSQLIEHPKSNYAFAATSNQTPNGVCIIVSANQTNKVMFNDIRTYKNKKKDSTFNFENSIYPDILMATIYLKCGKTVCIMGTRFSVSNINRKEKQVQIANFVNVVKKYRPRIIIGDYNWDTAIKDNIEEIDGTSVQGKEKLFCSYINYNANVKKNINCARFEMWPQDDNQEYYSHSAKNGIGYTCPDRIMIDTKTLKIRENNGIQYHPKMKRNSRFPDDWPVDHAMLVCEIELLEE